MSPTKNQSNESNSLWEILQASNKGEAERAKLVSMRDGYVEAVRSLFASIRNWLTPGFEKQLVHIREDSVQIDEEMLGQPYSAPTLRVSFPTVNRVVEIVPVGAFVVGARGRLDLRSGVQESILLRALRDHDSFAWCVKMPPKGGRGSATYPLLTEDLFLSEIKRIIH